MLGWIWRLFVGGASDIASKSVPDPVVFAQAIGIIFMVATMTSMADTGRKTGVATTTPMARTTRALDPKIGWENPKGNPVNQSID